MNRLGQKPLYLFLLLFSVGLLSRVGPWQDSLFQLEYDYLSLFSPAEMRNADGFLDDLALIYLDEKSHQLLDQPYDKPWDRDLHIQLIDKLTQAGARLVYFDILFQGASSDSETDCRLADAIMVNGSVVLVGQLQRIYTTLGHEETILPPYAPLKKAAAGWGIATFVNDSDNAIRTYPINTPGIPSSSQVAADLLRSKDKKYPPSAYTTTQTDSPHLVYFEDAPSRQANTFRYHKVLQPSFDLTKLKDKIVFVGAAQNIGYSGSGKDTFRSPYSRLSGKDWNGVDFHIVSLENHLQGKSISRASFLTELSALALAALLASGITLLPSKRSRFVYATLTIASVALFGLILSETAALTTPYLSLGIIQYPVLLSVVFLSTPKSKEVFISYSRGYDQEVNFAKPLRKALESVGLRVWLDVYDIKSVSSDFRKDIRSGVRASKFFILLLSKRSGSSYEILLELDTADDERLPKKRILMNEEAKDLLKERFGDENYTEYPKLVSEKSLLSYAKDIRKELNLSTLQLLVNKIQLRFRKKPVEHTFPSESSDS